MMQESSISNLAETLELLGYGLSDELHHRKKLVSAIAVFAEHSNQYELRTECERELKTINRSATTWPLKPRANVSPHIQTQVATIKLAMNADATFRRYRPSREDVERYGGQEFISMSSCDKEDVYELLSTEIQRQFLANPKEQHMGKPA